MTAGDVLLQSVRRSFSNFKDVGIVQVKVLRAEGLMVADVTGTTLSSSAIVDSERP